MILLAFALAAAQPHDWTPFNDHLVSNATALDVCAEVDDVDGCMADAHRAIICSGYLGAGSGHSSDPGLAVTCRRIICRSDYTDVDVNLLRQRLCSSAPIDEDRADFRRRFCDDTLYAEIADDSGPFSSEAAMQERALICQPENTP